MHSGAQLACNVFRRPIIEWFESPQCIIPSNALTIAPDQSNLKNIDIVVFWLILCPLSKGIYLPISFRILFLLKLNDAVMI